MLERGEVANSWKTERWESLRLLTLNWQSRLPGFGYDGDDPDGYRYMPQTIRFLEHYAEVISAPVCTNERVVRVGANREGYRVETDRAIWLCRALVLASGYCNIPQIPFFADSLPRGVASLSSMDYHNPAQLENGGVLVVGASASGTQIAKELRSSGRPVTLSVGEHIRAPRV